MKKILILLLAAQFFTAGLYSQNLFEEGEKLLLNNQLSDAAVMFEGAIEQEPENADAYLYLGYIYEVKQDYASAVSVMLKGVDVVDEKVETLYFNIANNYFKAGEYEKAVDMYTKAITKKSGYADAYLNRANTRVKSGAYPQALRDYKLYLNMRPADRQKDNIEKMISMLEINIAEQETRRKQEEQQRLAEEERQRALLESVLDSLSTAGSDTTNLSAESERIDDIEIELDIED
jgi:tetratricopeptide (TPR) repeat protein